MQFTPPPLPHPHTLSFSHAQYLTIHVNIGNTLTCMNLLNNQSNQSSSSNTQNIVQCKLLVRIS